MVYIDGKPHKMQLVEGTTYTGTYQYKTTLEAGNHNYYFVVTTPRYTVWFPPDSGVWDKAKRSRSSTDLSSRVQNKPQPLP